MNVKNIIFDNGNVLAEPITGHWLMQPNFWNILKMDKDTNYEILNNAIKNNQHLLTQDPKTEEEEYHMFSQFYYSVLKEINYINISEDIANKLAWDCVYNDDKYFFHSDVVKGLEKLSKKYNLYMITDAWPSTFRVLDNFKLKKYFKEVVVSSLESTLKEKGLFNIFINKNKSVIPEESIYIDDREDLLDMAKELGFNVLLIDRTKSCKDSKYNIIYELDEINKFI